MGYYNELAIICEDKAYAYLKEIMKNNNIIPDQDYESDNGYIIYFESVEYNDTIPTSRDLVGAIRTLDTKEDDGYGYHLFRQGEDFDDIQQKGNKPGYRNLENVFFRRIVLPEKKNA